MKKFITVVAITGALALSGCSGEPEPTPTVTVTATAESPTPEAGPTPEPSVTLESPRAVPSEVPTEELPQPTEDVEEYLPEPDPRTTELEEPTIPGGELTDGMFMKLLRDNTTSFANFTDAEVVDLIQSSCDAFDRGVTAGQVLQVLIDNSRTTTQARDLGFMLAAGVQNYCPEYIGELEALAG